MLEIETDRGGRGDRDSSSHFVFILSLTASSTMSKHRLSPALQPHPKRQHTILPLTRGTQLTFDNAFYDELILFIFAHLSWVDLCAIQSTNRNWSRLASDNEVYKLYQNFKGLG